MFHGNLTIFILLYKIGVIAYSTWKVSESKLARFMYGIELWSKITILNFGTDPLTKII